MSSDMDSPAIRVEALSKCYPIYARPRDRLLQGLWRGRKRFFTEFWALRDVDFTIGRGETVGIIGRNGAGKSTLLQIICGTLTPTQGAADVTGRVAALLELGAGFDPEFSGRENVYLNASIYGFSREEIDSKLGAILAFADIGSFIDRPVKTYSSGMYVRLAFAVIAHVDADVLIIDEALAVGDAFFTQRCMRFLRAFRDHGTVLFVSHDTAAVQSLCDRAIWLHQGRLRMIGAARAVSEAYLEDFYLGEALPPAVSNTVADSEVVDVTPPQQPTKVEWPERDFRANVIDRSALRNDVQVFDFDPSGSSFGHGGAKIVNVSVCRSDGTPTSWVIGGEAIVLRVEVLAGEQLAAPIVGFFIKDRRGQFLFGDNTFLSHHERTPMAEPGDTLCAEFHFHIPILPAGEYSVCAAIADGTPETHVVHHWLHEAMVLTSLSSSVSTGVVGIPMTDIEFRTCSPAGGASPRARGDDGRTGR